jgi:hypothetical protein
MKRTAILTLTAFYLLLTSGMFVCAVHCSLAKLAVRPEMQMAGTPSCSKPCCADKQHNCSKKHGSFTIKENVKPGYQIRFNLPLLTLQPVPLAKDFNVRQIAVVRNASWENPNAPPFDSGKALSIKFHSLLI